MSKCKSCGVGLIDSEKEEGICYSCKTNPKQKASTEKKQDIQENKQFSKVKTYKGKKEDAAKKFESDAILMAKENYFPVSQSYEPGTWGCGAFIVALLLCLILIGIIVFIYMLIVKPEGTLTVTYEYRGNVEAVTAGTDNITTEVKADEKVCPQCAETIKAAAKVCRYCRHKFSWKTIG